MLQLLLYTHSDTSLLLPVIWVVGGVVLLLLIAAIFVQRRTGRRLRTELADLAKLKRGNVEYELVLKTVKLSTWHIDPVQRQITYDSDFREGNDNYVPANGTRLLQIVEMMAPADSQRVLNDLESMCLGQLDYFHQQYRIRQVPSAPYYWEESFAMIAERDGEGMPLKIVGTSMRIDERKNMEAALINARNRAEESDRLKTAFLANMGHEIRTPLNAIVGFADLLPVVQSDEERNQLIAEIQANNHKLLGIINGLVSMSKIESEAKNLVKSQTDLNPILQQIVEANAATVDSSAVAVATQFPYTSLMMSTDVQKLTEMVSQLMQNAVKFTLKGNITLGYDLQEGDHVRIWVRDTGKGIAEEDQQRIFERFVKLDEYVPGTGLGLSVAQSHAKSLGGSIGVQSKLGEGSTFWVELPLT